MAFTNVEVLTTRQWNTGLFSFTVARPPSFRFVSGQFVMLGLMINGKPLLRAYSIVSPVWDETLEFLSIIVPDGPLTSHLYKIKPGDEILLGAKPTGTLTLDALLPGKRLHLIGTGTGLAPWMSIIRDPEVYERFEQITVQHTVREIQDLAYRRELEGRMEHDPLVGEEAVTRLIYDSAVTKCPTWTGENRRITTRIEAGDYPLNPETDRVMLCGSMAMIKETGALLESMGFIEGAHSHPGTYVLERAFVG
ncbi:ferredoxin--NADP reductase [Blastomonas fulva]|uniref:ferredoxin--NADP reductase n=1 Tax=Blastomonas fulva TaxID=1550728 RepID=UPI0025A4128D|nr:ferredoxin--NADP reductase [Blastomonas fulva]MDM7927622.1 ferredoxin--NADP reductase [Blastomonas fulva]MDM7965279.1 ferredoxin--NADP reductase [Blastomonas fulva]